jgi:hypothetical protein
MVDIKDQRRYDDDGSDKKTIARNCCGQVRNYENLSPGGGIGREDHRRQSEKRFWWVER